jgi:Uma2 family endonuclease
MPDATQLESHGPEMESSLHYAQLVLLVACLNWLWRDRSNVFIGATLTVYFSREQLKNQGFRGPDFFLVKGTEKRPRKSWVVWEEGTATPMCSLSCPLPLLKKPTETSKRRCIRTDSAFRQISSRKKFRP